MAQMTKEELFKHLASLRKANFAGGGRSPYKPLLILWAIGQLKTSAVNTYVYADVEQEISQPN
jgi:hypothetical protein